MASPDISKLDLLSPSWLYIKEYTEHRLVELRDKNESPGLNIDETNILKGKIQYAKEIIKLADEKTNFKKPVVENTDAEVW